MPFVPAPNIVQVEMRAIHNAQKVENRVMVNVLTDPTPAILSELAILAWDWWELTYAPLLPITVLLNEVVTTDMSAVDGGQVTYAPDATTTGENASGELPNEVSVCVSLRTGSRGRSARGRFFTLGVSVDTMADANNIETTYASALTSALGALITAIDTAGYQMSIVSYISDGVPRPGGPVYYAVSTAVITDTIVDSQRRRKPGVGS